jgi:site-specific DNA-methyltransferase (adenine-specific)
VIHHGDLFDVLPTLDAASISACVTDPPYGIGFMGKKWDTFSPDKARASKLFAIGHGDKGRKDAINSNLRGRRQSPAMSPSQIEYDRSLAGQREFQDWTERWAREVFRVLKPGGHILVCGAPRSYHRMACGIEDAGFEIRDCLAWIFGQGFPKSLNVGIAIDKAAGAMTARGRAITVAGRGDHNEFENGKAMPRHDGITDAAKQWAGWGTALKPAYEPIVLARKPLNGTVAANVLAHGTGALNIDACRISGEPWERNTTTKQDIRGGRFNSAEERRYDVEPQSSNDLGRWPANVLLDEDAAAILDDQSGETESGQPRSDRGSGGIWGSGNGVPCGPQYGDAGGVSRFFLVVDSRDSTIYNESCEKTLGATSGSQTAAGIGNGESQEAGRSISNLSTDGCGSKPTGQSQPDTKSTTGTTTRATTSSKTSNSSPKHGTTTTISDSEKITSSPMASSCAGASDAESIDRSLISPNDPPEPIKGIAGDAAQQASVSGESATESTTTPTCGSTKKHGGLDEICLTGQAPGLRFKYCPKSSREERDYGTHGLTARQRDESRKEGNPGGDNPRNRGLQPRGNFHPTVKPVDLMRWLVRLVTPAGGTVLDPFAGSGTTGMACAFEGFEFIGIEREAEYVAIAERRVASVLPLFSMSQPR